MKRLVLNKLAFYTASCESCLYPGETFSSVYGPAAAADLIFVGQGHRSAINWTWLRFHLDGNLEAIRAGTTAEIRRTLKGLAKRQKERENERGYHDSFLMHAAVIGGDSDTMQKAAEFTLPALRASKRHQYDAAVAGLMAAAVLGDTKRLLEQAEILSMQRPNKVDPWPSQSLVRAFVARDAKKFNVALEKAVLPHRVEISTVKRPKNCRFIVDENDQYITIDSLKKGSMFLWPYVECTFARMAVLAGMPVIHNSPWLPRKLYSS